MTRVYIDQNATVKNWDESRPNLSLPLKNILPGMEKKNDDIGTKIVAGYMVKKLNTSLGNARF